ncbi:MAG: hypothetical protein ACI4WH_00440 [Oscillospiraceae bacterium]
MKKIFKLMALLCTTISLCGCSVEFVDDTSQSTQLEDVTTSIESTVITSTIQTIEDTQTESVTNQTLESITTIEETFQETTMTYKSYSFRNSKLFASHYEKHGIDMGFNSPEEYLQGANDVINNPNALHKLEAEDDDDIYYLESTGEFVVVSTDGYIRTYYYASLDYFNRQ